MKQFTSTEYYKIIGSWNCQIQEHLGTPMNPE